MHDVLALIESQLQGVPATKTAQYGGHKYGLKLLDRSEEAYTKLLLPEDATLVQMFADNSVPTLAVALRSIDDVPVEELFGQIPDDMSKERREIVTASDAARTRFVRENVTAWLNSKPGPFVQDLWVSYLELKAEAREALAEMGPLSETTPSSESRPTS